MKKNLQALHYLTTIIDCSKYQTHFELGKIVDSGIKAIIHKASEGDQEDSQYIQRAQAFTQYTESNETAVDLLWGAYCVLNPFSRFNGTQQAQVFFNTLMKEPMRHILPVLDLEEHTGQTTGLRKIPSLYMIDQFITHFLKLMHQYDSTVKLPMIYGNAVLLNRIFESDNIKLAGYPVHQYPLWLSRYNDPEFLETPIAWKSSQFSLWQYSDGQHGPDPKVVPGCSNSAGHCDRSACVGSESELQAWWYKHSYWLSLPQKALSTNVAKTPTFFPPIPSKENVVKTLPNNNGLYSVPDIEKLSQQGIRVLMSKATEGESVQKATYKQRARAVLAFNEGHPGQEMLWVASHHLRASVSGAPENQAKNFVNLISQVEIPTILVVEIVQHQSGQVQTFDELITFMTEVNKLLDQKNQPFIIKGNPSHLDTMCSGNISSPLWVENYKGIAPKQSPTLPKAWSQAFIWEYKPNDSQFQMLPMTQALEAMGRLSHMPSSETNSSLRY